MNVHKNRVFGLDLLRAFAVLCVVYGHGYYLVYQVVPRDAYNLPVFDGVTMFFVLSGFLIGRILLKMIVRDDFDGNMLFEFWVRRWFRTLPNYFLVLVFLVLAVYWYRGTQSEFLSLYFLFSQNIFSPHPSFFREAWSLTVEEWFYLVAPIPLYLSAKFTKIDRRKFALAWIMVVIFSVTMFRFYRVYHSNYSSLHDWEMNLQQQVVTRLDSLMLGVLGAYISLYAQNGWQKMANSRVWVIGIGILLVDKVFTTLLNVFYMNYCTLTLSALGTLLLLPKLSTMERDSGLLVRTITLISLISYSMYLLNLSPIQKVILPAIMDDLIHLNWRFEQYKFLVQYTIYWVVTLVGSWLLYQYFEKPMTSLRDRFHVRGQCAVSVFADTADEKR